jgi:glutathione S-transferase
MTLRLHYHPLAAYCWKVLIPLYEVGAPFERTIVDLGDEASRAAFLKLSPMGKMPALQDEPGGVVVAESTIVIEYLNDRFPQAGLIPSDPDLARRTRFLDRVFDNYVENQMQKVIADILRPEGGKDPLGVEQARGQLAMSYAYLERELGEGPWAMGAAFTLADCSAAPALFYADKVAPLGEAHPRLSAYLERLKSRPSFARVLEEAQPYFHMFPG